MRVTFFSQTDWAKQKDGRYVKLIVPAGKWLHPSGMYELDASTQEARRKIVDAFRRQKDLGHRVPLMLNHDSDARSQVGWVEDMWEDEKGIWAKLHVTDPDAMAKIENGTWRGVSISLRDGMSIPTPDGTLVTLAKGVVEVSITPFPALPTATDLPKASPTRASMSFSGMYVNGALTVCAFRDEEMQGMRVQSLVLSKERFKSADDARAWVKEHGFRADKVDETSTSYRFRQFDPGECRRDSFRTKELTDGVTAVMCIPSSDQDSSYRREPDPNAKVRNRPQPIFPHDHPRVRDNRDHFPINTIGRARNALARAARFITLGRPPDWFRGTLKEFLRAVLRAVRARYPSIDTSGFEERMKSVKR